MTDRCRFARAIVLLMMLPCIVSASQQPVFRSGAQLTVVDVTVTGRDGRPLEGLGPDDFNLIEDGVAQAIAFVEFQRIDATASGPRREPAVDQPLAPPLKSTVVPQIATPRPGDDARYRDRRLVVLYFDLTAMPPADQSRAFAAAHKFVDSQMTSDALVAIMTFQGAVRVRHDFTASREELQDVLQTLAYGDRRNPDNVFDVTTDMGTAFGQDDAEFNILNTDRQLSALQTAMAMLRPLPQQKSLVYFSSGLRLNGVDNQAQLRATTNAAIRGNVAIFPVDARGLVAQAPLGDATQSSPSGGVLSGRTAETVASGFKRSQDTLFALAKDTGGKSMFDNNDLSLGIVQATEAIGSYYILGFYSTHTARDGRFRRLHVSLKTGLSADLWYRQGYFADKEFAKFTASDKERQLEDALMLENPITDIPMAVEVNYFQVSRAEYFVPVVMKLPGSELALARRRGATRTVIDVVGEVKDDYGITIQNVRDRLDIKLNGETAAQLPKRPIQYETGFTLLPGRYVIKLLTRDDETGRIGTYQTSFVIPNLNKEERRVPISSVVLSSQRVPLGEALYTVRKDAQAANPLVYDGYKLIPSVTRVFSASRDLYVFLEAYDRSVARPEPLIAFVTFYHGGERALETTPLAVSGGPDEKATAVPIRFSLPLANLRPGGYDCQVSVLDPNGQKAAFWRSPIVVVP